MTPDPTPGLTPQTTPEPASSEASGVGLILGSRLRQQVVGTTVALTLIAMAALTLLVHEVLASTVGREVSGLLQDRADAVTATLAVRDGQVVAQETPTETLDRSTWVYADTGRLVEGAPAEGALLRTVEDLATSQEQSTASIDDEYRLLAMPVQLGETADAGEASAVVVVAVNLTPYQRTEHYALLVTLALGFLVVLGSAGVAAWSLHRALEPVSVIADRAREWSERDLDQRFDLGEPRDEISSLATTFDTLLGRVAEVIRSEQRLSQEMAHELRTPLATVRAEAEIAALHPDLPEEPRAALMRIVTACDVMSTAITALMALARTGGGAGRSSPDEVLTPLLQDAPARSGVRVTVAAVPDGVLIAGPVDLVQRALSPVLDNAVTHAASRVTLRVAATGAAVEFHVEDDGPGVDPDEVERLFEPGHRGAASDGAGLGLSLARRVARSLGGDVDAVGRTETQAGGGHFVLTLPAAPMGAVRPPGATGVGPG